MPRTRPAATSQPGCVAPAGPETSTAPIAVNEELFAILRAGFNRVAAPFRGSLGETDEKIVLPTVKLKNLPVHQDAETLVKSIIVPRIPQCPTSQCEQFE